MAEWNGIRHITVVDRIRELVATKPDTLCWKMGDHDRSYFSVEKRAKQIAGSLAALGIEPGDRVATLAPNRWELIDLFFGLAWAGVIQVPLNPFLKGSFLQHQLADASPSVVFTDEAGWRALVPIIDTVGSIRHVVLLDGGSAELDDPRVSDYGSLPTGKVPKPELTPASTMSIVYTSGTTGQPKGCVLSHGYYTRAGQIDKELARLTEDDVFLTCLPMFHAGAQLKVIMTALMTGIPFHVEPTFSASAFFQRVSETGATIASAVGTMAAMIVASPPSPYDKDHRLRLFNAAPLSLDGCEKFMERFGVDAWVESYGQTECVPALAGDPYGVRDRSSAGRAPRDLEVALLDDDLQEVPVGEVGEICIRPRHRFAMFDGYWNNPVATLEAYHGIWYHTGDYGRVVASGNIAFVDRKKDALRVRGENVSSLELEAAIAKHPDVVEAAVHSVPSELEEDDIRVCVVVRDGATLEPEEFFGWLGENMPYYAVPRYVDQLDALPKNPVNRVLKTVLRDTGVGADTWDFRSLGLVVERAARR
jgi:crotonobetaine/carnitine-CoA ligase